MPGTWCDGVTGRKAMGIGQNFKGPLPTHGSSVLTSYVFQLLPIHIKEKIFISDGLWTLFILVFLFLWECVL